jgi:hypothetical protein
MSKAEEKNPNDEPKPRFHVEIEGQDYDWDKDTITVAEIRQLGNIPADQQIIEVDLKDQIERTLPEDEVIRLKPGQGFSKKVKFQRG